MVDAYTTYSRQIIALDFVSQKFQYTRHLFHVTFNVNELEMRMHFSIQF